MFKLPKQSRVSAVFIKILTFFTELKLTHLKSIGNHKRSNISKVLVRKKFLMKLKTSEHLSSKHAAKLQLKQHGAGTKNDTQINGKAWCWHKD